MKRAKITASALVLALLMAMSVLLAACGKTDDDSGNNNGGGTTEPGAPTHSFEIEVEQAPNLTYKSAEDTYVDASVMTDELVIVYDAQKTVTAEVAEGNVTLSEGTSETANGKKTDTYTVTATGTGAYTLNFNSGEEKVETFTSEVAAAYPADPDLPTVSRSAMNVSDIGYVHDPVVVEADGKYYEFNTDNAGGDYGYQVRVSEDLIHWTKQSDPAIKNCGKNDSDAKSLYESGKGGLQEVYDILKGDSNWNNTCWTLWAPEVTQAADGGWWLYGSWTTAFGSSHSVIFQCYSKEITGPYEFKDIIVYSYDGGGIWPNAIDAQIFYDGHKMYMTYGSFFGGIRILELDPATGLRKDGFTFSQHRAGEISDEEYYGKALVASDDQEGSVVAVKEVPVFSGDVFREEYMPQRVRLFSLVTSADSLFTRYNMRLFTSTKAEQDYMRPPYGARGVKLSSSFSWKRDAGDGSVGYDFFASGHCDLFETPDGRDLIVYHDRTPSGGRFHYLFLSLYAYNVRGEIVMSPNRYAGERLRPIGFGELAGQKFDYIALGEENDKTVYAKQGLEFQKNGSLAIGGRVRGEWKLYGDYFVSFTLDGEVYHGAAMPAWIERDRSVGITVSARGENGLPIFLNLAR